MASWQSSRGGRGTGRPRNLTLELGNSDFRLYFRGVGMRRLVAVLVAVGLVMGVGVLSAGAQEDFPAVDQPGVTPTEIKVGGVASKTNPLGGKYGDSFNGVKAYFDYVNDKGGIYGRELKLTAERDDQLGEQPSGGPGAPRRGHLRGAARRVAALQRRRSARRRGHPDVRVEHQRGVDRPAELLRREGLLPRLHRARASACRTSPRRPVEEGRRARLQRGAVRGVRRGDRELVQEVPERRGRVPRHQPPVRRRRLQRRRLPDARRASTSSPPAWTATAC